MILRPAKRDEILNLRAKVLRPGQPESNAIFKEDSHPECFHFGCFSNEGCRACVTIFPADWNGKPAWQLRGMAVHLDDQGKGNGKILLELVIDFVKKMDTAPQIWCNAREKAVPFYLKAGWITVGEFFDIPGVGNHIKMWRPL